MFKAIKSLPKLNGPDIQIVMNDLYETTYGVFNHLSGKQRPLANVAFHEAEDVNTDSLLEEAMQNYIAKGIKNYYNISFLEFLSLPRDVIEMMISVASKENSKKEAELAKVSSEFDTKKK